MSTQLTTESAKSYYVVTSDDQKVCIPLDVIEDSEMLKQMYEQADDNGELPPLSNIDKKTLDIIIDFYKMRRTVTDKDNAEVKQMTVAEDEAFFKDIDIWVFRDVANAVDFFHTNYLYQICCKKIARICESMTTLKELREWTGVEDDYPDEETRQKHASLSRWMNDDY